MTEWLIKTLTDRSIPLPDAVFENQNGFFCMWRNGKVLYVFRDAK